MTVITIKVGFEYPYSPIAKRFGWTEGSYYCSFTGRDGEEVFTKCLDKKHAVAVAGEYMLDLWEHGMMCEIKTIFLRK